MNGRRPPFSPGHDESARPPHPTHLPDAPAREHPGGVVHLGHQHAVPARCGAHQPRGVRRQRVLHRGHGRLRGADRRRGGHAGAGAPRTCSARSRWRRRRCCTASCGRSRRRSGRGRSCRCCSASGSRSSPARSRRGSSTRCTSPATRASSRPSRRGQMVGGAAMLGGSVAGGVIAQVTNLGVPFLMRAACCWLDVRRRVPADARPRLHAEPRRAVRSRRAQRAARVDRARARNPPVRWVMLAAPFTRASASTRSTRCSRTCSSSTATANAYAIAGLAAAIVAGAQIVGGCSRRGSERCSAGGRRP